MAQLHASASECQEGKVDKVMGGEFINLTEANYRYLQRTPPKKFCRTSKNSSHFLDFPSFATVFTESGLPRTIWTPLSFAHVQRNLTSLCLYKFLHGCLLA